MGRVPTSLAAGPRALMRVTILTVGSRGDVEPFIALGLGLTNAGFAVRLATHEVFRTEVFAAGLEFAHLPGNPRELRAAVEPELAARGSHQFRVIGRIRDAIAPIAGELARDAETVCRDADAIIYRDVLGFVGYSLAEALGVQPIAAALVPRTPTRAFAFPRRLPAGRLINRSSYRLAEQVFWRLLRRTINDWRTGHLGLRPYPMAGPYRDGLRRRVPMLYGFDEAIVPKPADWPAWHHVTGSWARPPSRDDQWSGDVYAFLADGPPPLYVGFGSSTPGDATGTTTILLQALESTGHRAVLATGWGGLDAAAIPASDRIYVVESVNHAVLFPRVAAVIHHGGAGTIAAGLRAGRPTIAIPSFGDQFFWADRVASLGAGPAPVPRRRLTAERLVDAIRIATTDTRIAERAGILGAQINREGGVERAVAIVQSTLANGARFPSPVRGGFRQ